MFDHDGAITVGGAGASFGFVVCSSVVVASLNLNGSITFVTRAPTLGAGAAACASSAGIWNATIDPNECLARCRIFIDANLMFATIDDDGPSIHASVQRRIVSI